MPWKTLRISPTTNPSVIRSAYVAVLRDIDVDRDPAAFIRLREAYEYALAACSGHEAPEPGLALDNADASDAAAYPDLSDRETLESEPDPHTVIACLLADHRVDDAWKAYNSFLATGAAGLDRQRPLAAMIVTAALQDADVTMETLRKMVALLGPEDIVPDDLTAVRNGAAATIAAHGWLDAVTLDATRWALGTRRYRVLAARSFVGRRHRLGRSFSQLQTICALLTEYDAHAAPLTKRVDQMRITALKARAALALKRKERRNLIFVCAVLVFVVVNVVYWNFFDN